MTDSWQKALLNDLHGFLPEGAVHLGIFSEPFLSLLLGGEKTIESRFSRNKIAPYGSVRQGDTLLVKRASGAVVAICRIGSVWEYEVEPESLAKIRDVFGERICATDDSFWEKKSQARYVTLMEIVNVTPIQPVTCAKRDRRGWVILRAR